MSAASFFESQMDYIFFVYGLAFVILSAVSFNMKADSRDAPRWKWLCLFGLFHGMNEWLDMFKLSMEEPGTFYSGLSVFCLTISFLFLFEFGRSSFHVFGKKKPGAYLYLLFVFVPCVAIYSDLSSCSAAVRNVIGLTGGLLSAAVMGRFGLSLRKRGGGGDLVVAAVFMAFYALSAGLITPKTNFFPGSIINQDNFRSLLGFPVQIIRAIFSIIISSFIWRYYSLWRRDPEFSSPGTRMVAHQYVAYLTIMIVVLAGWVITESGARQKDRVERDHVLKKTALVASAMEPELVSQLRLIPSDKDLQAYKKLKETLTRFGDSQDDIRYLYIMGMGDEGNVFFFLDAAPTRLFEQSSFAEPGEAYNDATDEFKASFKNGNRFVEGPVPDEWGVWISGLVPIFGKDGNKPIAVVGIDLDARKWSLMIAESRRLPILITLLMSCLIVLLFTVQIQSEIARDALRKSEKTLRDVLDHIHDAISVHSVGGEIIYVNNRMLDLYQVTHEKIVNMSIIDDLTVSPQGAKDFRAIWRKASKEGDQYFEWRTRRPGDKHEFDVDVYLCGMNLGDRPVIVATVRDITERKRVEDRLRILSLAIEQSPAAVIITDSSGIIQYVNSKFLALTRFPLSEIKGKSLDFLNYDRDNDEFAVYIKRALKRGAEWHGEIRHINSTGGFYWAQASLSPIRDQSGRISHYILVNEDTTDRKNAEMELERAKEQAEAANRSKSLFLANMSHEIRTPLNAILGFSQLLAKDDSLGSEQQKQLSIINKSGEHLLALINSVLEMSKIEAGSVRLELSPVDLHGLVKDLDIIFRARAEAKDIVFKFHMPPDLPRYIIADDTKLRQILTNLLGNALKFTDKGFIKFSVGFELHDSSKDMHTIRFEVEDSGSGIAEDELEKVFRYFEQARSSAVGKGGTGLGLAISREFSRLMDGDITVKSSMGKGSVFIANIVAASSKGADTKECFRKVVSVAPSSLPVSAHLVDDMDANRLLLRSILEPKGFDITESSNGAEALETIKKVRPDIVLMDMLMPVMDGYTATKILKTSEETSSIAVVAITASAFEEEKNRILEIGADGYIRKPFNIGELLETIRSVLGIEYVYKDEGERAGHVDEGAGADDAFFFRSLPPELLERIMDATVSADYDLLMTLVEETEKLSIEAGSYLRNQVLSFNYETIIEIIDCKKA